MAQSDWIEHNAMIASIDATFVDFLTRRPSSASYSGCSSSGRVCPSS